MQKVFHNILLPVYLNKETDSAVETAVIFANRMGCNLHLLYVEDSSSFANQLFRFQLRKPKISDQKLKLLTLQYKFADQMHPGYFMLVRYAAGKTQEEIINYSLSHGIDLVCLWNQPGRFSSGQPNATILAASAQCAVLQGRLQTGYWNTGKIIVPIGTNLPLAGMRVAISLAEQQGSVIHLITMEEPGTSRSMINLQKAYQLLKENTSLQLVCRTLNGNDFGHSAIEYARSIGCGLIVSSDERPVETKFTRWFFNTRSSHDLEVPVMLV